jgi:hypothetical protein
VAELAKVGFDPLFGARPLKRAIQQQRQLNAPERAPLGVPGKGERCGSEGACAPSDSANGLGL